jgi:hypothetical protein
VNVTRVTASLRARGDTANLSVAGIPPNKCQQILAPAFQAGVFLRSICLNRSLPFTQWRSEREGAADVGNQAEVRMRFVIVLGLVALLPLGSCFAATPERSPTKVFACSIGDKKVSVVTVNDRLIYRYGTASKDELSIVGIPVSGNIHWLQDRFAGVESQLRFTNGEYSYIIYSTDGNANAGAAATSGLIVARGTKVISERLCSPYAELVMPDFNAIGIPMDSEMYQAMSM